MTRAYTPHPYQLDIAGHQLALARSGVWAGMGTGKTVATLTAIDGMQFSGEMPEPFLVLAPKLVAGETWPREAAKWAHLHSMEVQPILGSPKERAAALRNRNAAGFSINYDNLPWLVEQFGDRWPFKLVVADESTRLKSFRLGGHGGQRAKAIAKVAHKHVARWVNLTGTPAGNGYADLWGQTWFLDAGQRLGRTFTAFDGRFFKLKRDGFGKELLPFAKELIDEAIADLHLTVEPPTREEPIENVIEFDLPAKARALYRDMEREMFVQIAGHDVEAFNAASRTIKCLQLANGAAYLDDAGNWSEVHDMKLRILDSIVEEANGAPVLVGYHFKSDRARIMRAFPHAIDVGTPDGLKRALAGEGRVWLGHPKSMGHGVDGLQEHCNILAMFGHWWSLEEYEQLVARIGPVRQKQSGKDRPVFVHQIVARDTVDELVIARRRTKREVQDLLLEAMKRRN